MLRGQMPLAGVQKGQRWLREDPGDSSKLILEITRQDETCPNTINGIVLQVLEGEGKPRYKQSVLWTVDLIGSYCYYTVLQGQDKPS